MKSLELKPIIESYIDGNTKINLPYNICMEFFNDGRVFGRLLEFIISNEYKIKRSCNEGSFYDNETFDGKKIEVRSLTNQVSFAPSKEIGSGRKVTKEGVYEKLNLVDEFWIGDLETLFTNTPIIYTLTREDVFDIFNSNIIRKNFSVGRSKFLKWIQKKK